MKTKLQPMNAIRFVKVKKMGEILFKAYIMRVARAFWKIDKKNDDDLRSETSTVCMNRKYGAPHSWNCDFSERRSMRSPPRADSNYLTVKSKSPKKQVQIVNLPTFHDGFKTPKSERSLRLVKPKKSENRNVKSTARIKKPVIIKPPY